MARSLGQRFTYPAAWDKTKGPFVRPVRDYLVGDVKPALLLLLGAGALLLLMACANTAALVLARTTDRSQEISLRAALGAGRGRLARQIVAESLTFSVVAGAVGLGIAVFGFDVLVGSLPLKNNLAAATTLDWTVYAAAFGLAAVVGLLVAAAPVRDLLSGRLHGVTGSRGATGLTRGTGRVHSVLVAGEAGVAVLLVVGAMLLIRSVSGLLALDLGFRPAGVVAVDVFVPSDGFPIGQRTQAFQTVRDRAAAIPGVTGAAWIGRLPVRDDGGQGPIAVEGQPDLQGTNAPNALWRPVSPDYFKTLGIPIVDGRAIEPGDRAGTPRVGLVSRAFAVRVWPGQSPIGRRVRFPGGDTVAISVVGVAGDVRSTGVTGANPFVLYLADAQDADPPFGKALVLRAGGPPGAVFAAVRRIAAEVDPRLAIARTTTMEQVVETALAQPLQLRFFLTLFAALALVLGVVGIYSVVAYSVSRRQTELGLRMALGAAPGQVLRQIIGEGVAPVVVGTGLGLVAAVALARGASRFLYGVSPADPVSMGAAALALLTAGVAAAALPAWRASRVSPTESLRAE